MAYQGNHPATHQGVKRYLVEEYGMDPKLAAVLMDQHSDILDNGIRLGSFDYYVGDEIARVEQGLS